MICVQKGLSCDWSSERGGFLGDGCYHFGPASSVRISSEQERQVASRTWTVHVIVESMNGRCSAGGKKLCAQGSESLRHTQSPWVHSKNLRPRRLCGQRIRSQVETLNLQLGWNSGCQNWKLCSFCPLHVAQQASFGSTMSFSIPNLAQSVLF